MIENDSGDVASAFEMLPEEIEAKIEFVNVVDHFTVAGELYER